MSFYYVTDGFQNDADLLLKEFTLEQSSEFRIFASIWRKRNFSFIFMGHDSKKELCEFTNETFSFSLKFLESECFFHQIGGVFLLYALYRNQILNPPVCIRVDYSKFEIMKNLLDKAKKEKLHSLHFILNYLSKNAFEFVASLVLLGPCVRIFDDSYFELEKKLRMSGFRSNLEECMEHKILESLGEFFAKYNELKPTPQSFYTKKRCMKLVSIMKKLALDQIKIDGRNNNSSRPTNLSSVMRYRRATNKLRYEYPFLDFNETSDIEGLSENDYIRGNNYKNTQSKKIASDNKDGGKSLDCNEQSDEFTVFRSNCKKLKKNRERVKKTCRIRKYYEGSPIKNKIVPSVDALLRSDSQDELICKSPDD